MIIRKDFVWFEDPTEPMASPHGGINLLAPLPFPPRTQGLGLGLGLGFGIGPSQTLAEEEDRLPENRLLNRL